VVGTIRPFTFEPTVRWPTSGVHRKAKSIGVAAGLDRPSTSPFA